ncbi:MAG: WbqC family protein [candidate division Zixibacteria bacterium]|nr:WbqC family protein [candidate division Zixibacteria bacterium]
MILTAHQPVYLPWLGLFHKITLADTFVSFNQVQYLKKDWNNRNKIKASTDAVWLTVPVLSKGYMTKTIAELEINNNVNWRRKHWRSIYLNYKSAPYFDQYAPILERVYCTEWNRLSELNDHMLRLFLDMLGIEVTFLDASNFQFRGRKSDLVLDMCKQLEAEAYIFGGRGRDYADVDSFRRAGIEPIFQEYNHPQYSQLHGEFIPNLAIIDLLFNCGDRSLEIIMEGNLSRHEIRRSDLYK